ncbi:ATP-binding protein [Oceanobacillus iheyensis]|uniref:HAMP domain-containing sensor histidine kinase n=1 Tax=Oceanobacillus iheyensis TaxID=182710 RepID=UPI001E5966C0|nr:HAMP domain-containing sensor histidine kinase [Oceanobacillus iheyensis]
MFINKSKRIPMRRYWTSRYLITLCVGLLIIAILSVWWIRHSTLENRVQMMELLTEDMADRYTESRGERPQPGGIPGGFPDQRWMGLEQEPLIYIIDRSGEIISRNRPMSPLDQEIDIEMLDSTETVQTLKMDDQNRLTFYMVKSPIVMDDTTIGWVMMAESKQLLTKVNHEYKLLATMIISLALLGWAAIYILTKRLSDPIKQVANAARNIEEGDYKVELSNNSKEEEIHELVSSFKGMANRLERLEAIRTELLAGVTHELKTPVTSISGLLQAINDDVVNDEERKEFLEISLKETEKMQTMIEDLLAFNSFASSTLPLNREKVAINETIEEIVHDWEITNLNNSIRVEVERNSEEAIVEVDWIRLEQIITNLFNNASQAMSEGIITVKILIEQQDVWIYVVDGGIGIPMEEQALIFERFYRGNEKKYSTRGLGLGLALSKMIAQAMNGDLTLLHSDKSGTTMKLQLPIVQENRKQSD